MKNRQKAKNTKTYKEPSVGPFDSNYSPSYSLISEANRAINSVSPSSRNYPIGNMQVLKYAQELSLRFQQSRQQKKGSK